MLARGIKWTGCVTIVVTVAIWGVHPRVARIKTEQAPRRATDGRLLDQGLGGVAGRAADAWSWQDAHLPRTGTARDAFDPLGVAAAVVRVADWQLRQPVRFGPDDWTVAALYDGLIDASLVTGDPKYLATVVRAGRQEGLQPVPRVYVVDDRAMEHAWLRIILMDPKAPTLLQTFQDRAFTPAPDALDVPYGDRWTFGDRVRMAPATLALLARATRDQRYLQLADAEFRATYDALFDREAKLVYCDARFVDMRTPDGRK